MINTLILAVGWAVLVYLCFFFELKLVADFQARMGPNRIGLGGFWSPLANFSRQLFSSQERKLKNEDFDLLAATLFFSFSVATSPLLAGESFLNEQISIPVCIMSFLVAVVFFAKIRAKGIIKFLFHAQFITGVLVVAAAILALGVQDSGLSWMKRPEGGLFEVPVLIFAYFSSLAGGFLLLFEQPFGSIKNETAVSGYRKFLFEIYRRSLLLYWIVLSILIFMGGFRKGIDESSLDYIKDLLMVFSLAGALFLVSVWVAQSQVSLRSDQSTRVALRYVFPASIVVLIITILSRFQWV